MNRRKMLIGSGAGILLGLGFVIRSSLIENTPPPVFVLSCKQVINSLPDYAAGRLRENPAMELSIRVHLEDCSYCERKFQELA